MIQVQTPSPPPGGYDQLKNPRTRRLCSNSTTPMTPEGHPPVHPSGLPATPRLRPSPPSTSGEKRANEVRDFGKPGASGLALRLEATGSLLPQPHHTSPRIHKSGAPSPRRHGNLVPIVTNEGSKSGTAEATYDLATIRRVYGIILQSALDLSFPQALERVLTAAKNLTNSKYAQIFFIEKAEVQPGGLSSSANLRLKLKGKGGQDKEFPCEGIAGVCAQDNAPILCNRPHHDARFNPEIDWAPGSGVKTVACCPMTTVNGKVVGVIQVSNKVIGGYHEEDLHFLDLLGKQAAVTFDLSVKNEQRIAHQRKATSLIKGFVKLAGTASPAQLAHKAGLLCKEVCGSIQANCFLAEEGKSDFVSWMKLLDDKADVYKEQQVGFKGFLSEVFLGANSNNRSLVKAQGSEDNNVRSHLGSMYCPISANGKAIGIVKARGNRKGQFSEVDERMLSAISNMVGVLHENMTRTRIVSDADSGRPWESIDEAISSIKQAMSQAANVHTVGVLFYEGSNHCFWTVAPQNLKTDQAPANKYLRVNASDFPMWYVLEKKCVMHYPSKLGTLSEREIAHMRLLARKFLPPQFDLESMLLVPMLAQGQCVSVLLLLNKHNMSGPFDSYVEKTAQHFAAQWGARLASTLHEERMRTEVNKIKITFRALPSLATAQSLEGCLFRLGRYIAELLGAETCWVMTVDKRGSLRVVLQEAAEAVRVDAVDSGLPGEAATRKETIIVDNADDDDRHCAWLATKANIRIKASMCAPIYAATMGEDGTRAVVGVVQVMNKVGEVVQFSDKDADQLELLCPVASTLLENTTRLGELETLQKDVKISFERRNLIVSETASLHQLSSTRGLLSRCRRLTRSLLAAAHCNVFLVGYDRDSMFELLDDLREQSYYEEQRGIVGHVIRSGEAVVFDADNADPLMAKEFNKDVDQRGVTAVSSLLCVPLVDEDGRVLGAWHLCNCLNNSPFRDEDAHLLQTLGRHLVEALSNEQALSKMLECNRRLRDCVALEGPSERLRQIALALKKVISAERVNVFVRSGQVMVASDELTGHDIVVHLGQGYVGRCATGQTSEIMANINKDARFRPSVDGRTDITIQHALYVPVLNHSAHTILVIEVLNKVSAPFDSSDVLVAEIMGANALDAVERQSEYVQLEEARRQALQLLTSVQYLYPVNSDTDTILNSAVGQMAHVLKAKARIYLGIPTDGGVSDESWNCYDSEGSALSGLVSIGGVAGSCFMKVAPIMISSQDVGEDDEDLETRVRASPVANRNPRSFASSPTNSQGGRSPTSPKLVSAGDGHENTSTILCQPLMDAVSQNPIGVLEFRRVQQDLQAVESFTVLDQELAYHLSVLLVHAMVNHSKRMRGDGVFSRRTSNASFDRSPS